MEDSSESYSETDMSLSGASFQTDLEVESITQRPLTESSLQKPRILLVEADMGVEEVRFTSF